MSEIDAHRTPRRNTAIGSVDPAGRLTVACRFDEELFEEIRGMAVANGVAFAEQVRRLVRCGLQTQLKRAA